MIDVHPTLQASRQEGRLHVAAAAAAAAGVEDGLQCGVVKRWTCWQLALVAVALAVLEVLILIALVVAVVQLLGVVVVQVLLLLLLHISCTPTVRAAGWHGLGRQAAMCHAAACCPS
jgi:sensor histidine kinase YesM